MADESTGATDTGEDVLGSMALFLNVAAVISTALWLSMVGGASASGSTALAGMLSILLFGSSVACFAVDRPAAEPHGHPVPLAAGGLAPSR